MKASLAIFVAAFCLIAGSDAASAQGAGGSARLVGTWIAQDPATGQQEQLIITDETLQFGPDEPQIPYAAEGSGDSVALYIGGPGNPPTSFTFLDANTAELEVPDSGGQVIALTRASPAPAQAAAGDVASPDGEGDGEAGGATLMDELTAALVPYGVSTRFEPMKQSLETLLSAGWKLDQAAGASGGFTLLLTKGSSNALCILVPKNLGQADTALSDCRQLN
jgi:hypothetical protein